MKKEEDEMYHKQEVIKKERFSSELFDIKNKINVKTWS